MCVAKVKIPFKKWFDDVLLDGSKTWTSRTKKYGESNDTFEVFGQEFILEKVFKMNLGEVASYHYKEEGCRSREQFIKIWRKIHPRKGFDPTQEVWVHQFRKNETLTEEEGAFKPFPKPVDGDDDSCYYGCDEIEEWRVDTKRKLQKRIRFLKRLNKDKKADGLTNMRLNNIRIYEEVLECLK